MLRLVRFAAMLVVFCVAFVSPGSAADWPAWRGPSLNGIAPGDQTPPTEWSTTKNVVWSAPVPGRGCSSPIVVGDKVILTTADEQQQVQSVLAYNRTTGAPLWKTDVLKGGLLKEIHKKNTHASPTPAWDGQQLIVTFANRDAVQLAALSIDGDILWQKTAGGFTPQIYKYGYAPSPAIYKESVIIAAEYESGGYIKAFDRKSGRELWSTPRTNLISFSTPVVANVGGRDQLLISGGDRVTSYDPGSGQVLWQVQGASMATCGTVVWEGDMVFASGGYPGKETLGVKVGPRGAEVVWRNGEKCYEQSLLVSGGYVYAINDNGIAFCWDSKTGKEMWKTRLGGPVSASPVLAGGNIYYSDERGTTYVFKATPEKFTPVASNKLGSESFATPTIIDNQIFLRHADSVRGQRQEMLFCIVGSKS